MCAVRRTGECRRRRRRLSETHRRRPTMAGDQLKRVYESMPGKLDEARRRFGRPLTLAEKILVAHADDFAKQEWSRGKAQLRLRVDRVALQDATGQMALLQFMQAGKKRGGGPGQG